MSAPIGTPIPLESITQFWKLDNWNQGWIFLSKTNLEFIAPADTPIRPCRPANNISIIDITHASQSNDRVPTSELLNSRLNHATFNSQRIHLEQQLHRLLE